MEKAKANSQAKIDVSQIPKYQMDALCQTILDGCKKFYADPKNVKKYEEWRAKHNNK